MATGALASGWPRMAAAASPAGLAKCVAMDSLNHGGDVEDLRVNGNLDKLRALGTRWVRLWIRWDKAQLFPPGLVPIGDLDGSGERRRPRAERGAATATSSRWTSRSRWPGRLD